MTIIIEGPNGAGKTTLANQLADFTGYTVVHATKPGGIEEAERIATKQLKQVTSSCQLILDRVQCISDVVYNPVMSFKQRKVYLMQAKLMAKSGILIYCTGNGEPDYDKPHYDAKLIKQCKEEQDLIRSCYNEAMHKLPKVIYYNFKNEGEFEKLIAKRSVQLLKNVI